MVQLKFLGGLLMKKFLFSILICTLVVLGGLARPVDAATNKFVMSPKVVVLPMVSTAQELPDGVSSQIMDKLIQKFQYPKFNLLADDVATDILNKVDYIETVKKQGLSAGLLKNIMLATNSDMVVAVYIKDISSGFRTTKETDYATLTIKMEMMAAYSWQDKVVSQKLNDYLEEEYVVVHRSNWPAKEVGRAVNRFLDKATK